MLASKIISDASDPWTAMEKRALKLSIQFEDFMKRQISLHKNKPLY